LLYRQSADTWGIANGLVGLASTIWNLGNYGDAKQYATEGLTTHRTLGNQEGMAQAMRILANIVWVGEMDAVTSEQLNRNGLQLYRELNQQADVAEMLSGLGATLGVSGRFVEAEESLKEGIAILTELGMRSRLAHWYNVLGVTYAYLGDYQQAEHFAHRGLTLSREVNYQGGLAGGLRTLGQAALANGQAERAYNYLKEGLTIARRTNQHVELVGSLVYAGTAQWQLKNELEAVRSFSEALQSGIDTRSPLGFLIPLSLCTLLLIGRGQVKRAVELYALLRRYPYFRARHMEDIFGHVVDAASATLPSEVAEAARARGEQLDLRATAEALLEEVKGWIES
jgi:tetratricopeptide (TPR) repeat protein